MLANAKGWFKDADKEVDILKSTLKEVIWENADGQVGEIDRSSWLKKIDNDYNEYGSQNLEIAYELVKKKFLENRNVKIMRKSSSKASKEFSDNYFDFIYIDGNHSYKFVKEDLNLWFPKLNNKGILFGDDYLRPYGVQKAVAEFSYEKKLIVHFTDNGNQYYFVKDSN